MTPVALVCIWEMLSVACGDNTVSQVMVVLPAHHTSIQTSLHIELVCTKILIVCCGVLETQPGPQGIPNTVKWSADEQGAWS